MPDTITIDVAEDRIMRAEQKLAALTQLLSQYRGELEFTDDAAHGLAMIVDDIRAGLSGKGRA